jgi:hypothetical protein
MSATFAIRERVGRVWYMSISCLLHWQLSPRQKCTIMDHGQRPLFSSEVRVWEKILGARARQALTRSGRPNPSYFLLDRVLFERADQQWVQYNLVGHIWGVSFFLLSLYSAAQDDHDGRIHVMVSNLPRSWPLEDAESALRAGYIFYS